MEKGSDFFYLILEAKIIFLHAHENTGRAM